MAALAGRVISLPVAKARQARLASHLQSLGIHKHYSFFPALRGSVEPDERRGLSPGEDGLWKSVLAVLSEPLSGADYLHILEDDAELSHQFWRWLQRQPQHNSEIHLLFTDMYAGPTLYPALLARAQQARQDNQIQWLAGQAYTGCTTSWLIPQQQVSTVRRALEDAYHNSAARIPLDNQLRRLVLSGELKAAISLPFLTSINLAEQTSSSIQQDEPAAVQATRLLGALLRRRLSVLQQPDDLQPLGSLLATLLDSATLDQWLATGLIPALQHHQALRYRFDARLLAEPDNGQAKREAPL
jgi:hypothetical protein